MDSIVEESIYKDSMRMMRRAGAIYLLVCAICSFFIAPKSLYFSMGLIIGFAAMLMNYRLLWIAINLFINKRRIDLALCVYLLRLAIYAVVAVVSYFIGMKCLMGYVFGVMTVVVGAVAYMVKGGRKRNDQLQ